MISKPKVRFIKSLQVKKYRLAEQCFVVQGAKAVNELLASDYTIELLCATPEFLRDARNLKRVREVLTSSERELTALGSVESNNAALAVVNMKATKAPVIAPNEFTLALDGISDPGNLGTIIRTADWYGIKKIIASENTTDMYSPKVISATMGSFLRVEMNYGSLPEILSRVSVPVYGTFLDGQDVHKARFASAGIIIIGSESHGISEAVAACVTQKITIPRFGNAESLNASVATAVVLDNLRRS